ncbi:MAG: trypsin-like peptidase domain-containing protein [Candidatus Eisenbacteria bacterium]|nr:trypsin-like peptidase domain-containing protein [Candidatus Eisenbacteria bacterium]MCC7143606.1 trypsin-like peptidase domain-containing protein [Candidatus Eisenbacteria bacterium]
MAHDRQLAARFVLWTGAVLVLGALVGVGASSGLRPGAVAASASTGDAGTGGESPFVGVAETVLPGVVSVEARRWVRHPALDLEDESERPGLPDDEIEVPSSGSGFIFDPSGIVFTNAHVVNGASGVWVHLFDGRNLEAEVIGADSETDVAVLRVRDDAPLPSVPLGDSEALKIGDWVAAIGNPLGMFEGSLTVGVVSAKGRNEVSIRGGAPTYQDFIQTDASINFGNSGGPLVNRRGEAVGINTAFSGPGNGISFAIPMNLAREIADGLVSSGRVVRGYLGVVLQDVNPDLAAGLKLKNRRGALVREVQPGTPAEEAGMRAGDVILEYDGERVRDVPGLRLRVARSGVGRKVPIVIHRFGAELRFEVAPAERPGADRDTESAPKTDHPDPTELGLGVARLPRDAQVGSEVLSAGVLVESVDPAGVGADIGIETGDVVLEVDGAVVAHPDAFADALRHARGEARPAVLRLARGDARWYVALPLGEIRIP